MKTSLLAISLGIALALFTQGADPGIAPKYAIGEVKTIDAAARQLTIKTDAGSTVSVVLSDKTTYKKLAPGETSLTNASDITFADVAEGDPCSLRSTAAMTLLAGESSPD